MSNPPGRLFDSLAARVARKGIVARRIARLDQKSLELFSKHAAVRRYVAIQHLRAAYGKNVNDLKSSIESLACRIAAQGHPAPVQTSPPSVYGVPVEQTEGQEEDSSVKEENLKRALECIP